MKNKYIIIVSTVLIVGLSFWFFFWFTNESVREETFGDVTVNAISRYKEFDPDVFKNDIGKKRIYFFHANWCPTCLKIESKLKMNAKNIPDKVMVYKANYDNEIDLRKVYNVEKQCTFVVIDEKGEEIKKWYHENIDEIFAELNQL